MLAAGSNDIERPILPRPQRVLIVDDSEDIRELWRLWLTFWGFEVEEATDGAEAVRRAKAHRPDLVLMDLWMPVLDGLDATAQLKANRSTTDVPVLALSADVFPPTPDRARAAGCDAFLAKPLDPDSLLEEIRVAFRRVLQRREGLSDGRVS
jgi:two-component system cell cycle response regulator DivK